MKEFKKNRFSYELKVANCFLQTKSCVLPIAYCLLLIGVFFLNATPLNAQTPITLQQAIDTALKNNLTVKNERLRTEYRQKLIQSGTHIPATGVFGEFGQMNSAYFDTKLGVSQTISFPKVYSSQKNLLGEEWKSSVLNVNMNEAALKRLVTAAFFNLDYLQKKRVLLQQNDSLFAAFLSKATLRFNKGESNILEKTTAENQRGQIGLQLAQLQRDWELQQLQFQLLLNTTSDFVPGESEAVMTGISIPDTGTIASHPAMQYWRQQQNIAAANTKAEQAKLLPDLSLGYNLMGMKGLGADDKEYNSTPRFQSFQVGLGIPIFTGGQKARINASKINEQVTANEYDVHLKSFTAEYATAIKQFQKYDETVKYFENTALKNAVVIQETANKQFLSGEINFLDWVILINQAISIQSDYTEAVRSKNLAVAELNFYNNQ